MKNLSLLLVITSILAFYACGSDVQCPLCHGGKQVAAGGRDMDCPVCKGDGSISESKYEDVTEMTECKICDGTGSVSGLICSICNGSGRCSELQQHMWLCSPANPSSDYEHGVGDEQKGRTSNELCFSCRGSGRCQVCNGMGYTEGYGLSHNSCSGCWHPGGETYDGDGKCSYCHGTGHVDY